MQPIETSVETKPGLAKPIAAYTLLAIVGIALVAIYAQAMWHSRTAEKAVCLSLDPVSLNLPAPTFTLPDLNGTQVSLEEHRGKIVLLHLWATWCPPCLEELPSLVALQQALNPKEAVLLPISVDDNAEIVKKFYEDHRFVTLPTLIDPKRDVAQRYGTEKFPESFLIDRNGVIRYRFVNQRNWASNIVAECFATL